MKDRADYARKGIARGRSVVVLAYDDGIAFVAENPSPRAAQDLGDLRPHRASPRSASTTSSRTCGSPACATPTCAATPTTGTTSRRADWPTPTPRRWARSSPRSPSRSRSRSSSPRSARDAAADQIYRLTYDGSVADEHGFVVMGGGAEQIEAGLRGALARGADLPEVLALAVDLLGNDPARWPTARARPRGARGRGPRPHRPRRTFRRIAGRSSRLLGADDPTRDAPDIDEADGDGGTVRDATTNPQTQRPTQDGPPA